MQDFLKNILNYYAAFTETRFSSRSTLKYQWTNDISLTLDISFFPEFRRLWLDRIASVDAKSVDIRPRQYAIPLSVPAFRERLGSELHDGHDLNAEYHTEDSSVVRSLEDFREDYLEYDVRRQLELESYGYRFLRINKFSLAPCKKEQTRLDVLNGMIEKVFAV